MGWCGYSFLQSQSNWFAVGVASFSPFTGIDTES